MISFKISQKHLFVVFKLCHSVFLSRISAAARHQRGYGHHHGGLPHPAACCLHLCRDRWEAQRTPGLGCLGHWLLCAHGASPWGKNQLRSPSLFNQAYNLCAVPHYNISTLNCSSCLWPRCTILVQGWTQQGPLPPLSWSGTLSTTG